MKPTNPKHFDQGVYDLFDKYVHGDIDRRGFLDGAGKFAVGGMTATMITGREPAHRDVLSRYGA